MQESARRQANENCLNGQQQVNLCRMAISALSFDSKKNERKQRRNLRVRFATEPQLSRTRPTLNLEEYTIQELNNCWWNGTEQEGARLNAKYIASVAKKSPILRKIETTFSQIRDTPFGPSLIQDYMIKPPHGLLIHLAKWSSTAHSVRGLERWASSELRKSRSMEAVIARDVVLTLYHSECSSDIEIAQRYAEETLTSAMFARFVGQADRIAATAELQKPSKSEVCQQEQQEKQQHHQQQPSGVNYDLMVQAGVEKTQELLFCGNTSPERHGVLSDATGSNSVGKAGEKDRELNHELQSSALEKIAEPDVFKFDATDVLKSKEKSPSSVKKPTVKVNVPFLSGKRVRSPAA